MGEDFHLLLCGMLLAVIARSLLFLSPEANRVRKNTFQARKELPVASMGALVRTIRTRERSH